MMAVDLMGINLMDPARRDQVLEVSQKTTPRQLGALIRGDYPN